MEHTHFEGQIDFELYKILHGLTGILEPFPNAPLQQRIADTIRQLQNKKFRIAVAGEFRRGKSSLINALLGMSILPVDIEPTTATINRITYGLRPKAYIHYKDGRGEEVPIDALANYVTKLTQASAQVAATVREAEICYPTELCRNGIDIIDTPGLNDTESMTAVTDELLQDIHAALIAVKATMPYSDTECEWVTRLIALPNLQHLIFVSTCMDLVPRRDQTRVLTSMRQRIREHTLARVQARYADQPEVLAKAEALLSERALCVYPVSALQALDAFDSGDFEALEDSRLPELKKALVTILNTQQQLHGLYNVRDVLSEMQIWFQRISLDEHVAGTQTEMDAVYRATETVRTYFAKRQELVEQTLQQTGQELEQLCAQLLQPSALDARMRACYIRQLSAVRESSAAAVTAALQAATEEVRTQVLSPLEAQLRKSLNAAIIRRGDQYLATRGQWLQESTCQTLLREAGIPPAEQLKACMIGELQQGMRQTLPTFSLTLPKKLRNLNVMPSLVQPAIQQFLKQYAAAWQAALPEYYQRALCAMLRDEPMTARSRFAAVAQQQVGRHQEQRARLREQYARAAEQLAEANATLKTLWSTVDA